MFFLATQQHVYKCTNFFKSISRVSFYPNVHYLLTMCKHLCGGELFFFVMCIEGRKKASQKKMNLYIVSHSLLSMYTHFFRLFGSLISFVVVVAAVASNFFMYFLLLPPTLKKPKFRKIFFFYFFMHNFYFLCVGCKSESSPGSLCSFLYTFFRIFFF